MARPEMNRDSHHEDPETHTDRIESALSRRRFLLALSGLTVPLLTGCGYGLTEREPAGLTVGLCDALAKGTASECVGDHARREYAGLADAVRSETGLDLRFRRFKLDQQLAAAVRDGQLDAVICKTWTALRSAATAGRRFQRLADIPAASGSKLLRGAFIVRPDSSLKTLADISGKTFAVGSDSQYESSFQARATLTRAGVQPAENVTIESCLNVAALVWQRKADVGVVSHYCVDHSGLQLVGDPDAFRLIGRTAGVPFITFAVSEDVPPRTRARLSACLLKLTGRNVPEDLDTPGLIAPVPWMPRELAQS